MKRCRLNQKIQNDLVKYFVLGVTARSAGDLPGVQVNTACLFYHKLRVIISTHLEIEAMELFSGEIELDESYFGGTRKGMRGRGASGKVAVFGILKRHGKVYTKMVSDPKTQTLLPIIKEKIKPDSIVYTDNYRGYYALDVSEFRHLRINHYKEFVDFKNKRDHINGIENFRSQAKRHLRRYNGVPKRNFSLFLKECEWRFNYGNPKNQLKILRKWIKDG